MVSLHQCSTNYRVRGDLIILYYMQNEPKIYNVHLPVLSENIFVNLLEKGKILQSGRGVNSISITILRLRPSS